MLRSGLQDFFFFFCQSFVSLTIVKVFILAGDYFKNVRELNIHEDFISKNTFQFHPLCIIYKNNLSHFNEVWNKFL